MLLVCFYCRLLRGCLTPFWERRNTRMEMPVEEQKKWSDLASHRCHFNMGSNVEPSEMKKNCGGGAQPMTSDSDRQRSAAEGWLDFPGKSYKVSSHSLWWLQQLCVHHRILGLAWWAQTRLDCLRHAVWYEERLVPRGASQEQIAFLLSPLLLPPSPEGNQMGALKKKIANNHHAGQTVNTNIKPMQRFVPFVPWLPPLDFNVIIIMWGQRAWDQNQDMQKLVDEPAGGAKEFQIDHTLMPCKALPNCLQLPAVNIAS